MYQHKYTLHAKPVQPIPLWQHWREMATHFKISDKARLRLEWIIFYHTAGDKNAVVTAKQFGIARSVFYYWLSRFDEANMRSLEDTPSRPKTSRAWLPDPLVLERMLRLRKKFMHWGKEKLAVVYETDYGEKIASWQFQRMIETLKLYPPRKKNPYRGNGAKKERITKAIRNTGDCFFSLDSIILHDFGVRRYIITAVEHTTKIAYARVYPSHASAAAKDFLERLHYLMDGHIVFVLTDNGSEFAGEFEKTCQAKKLKRYFTRVQTPTDNPEVERFNRTLQEEWLNDGNWYQDIRDFNRALTQWLVIYNDVRPHETLKYKTPLQYLETHPLSKTSSSRTTT